MPLPKKRRNEADNQGDSLLIRSVWRRTVDNVTVMKRGFAGGQRDAQRLGFIDLHFDFGPRSEHAIFSRHLRMRHASTAMASRDHLHATILRCRISKGDPGRDRGRLIPTGVDPILVPGSKGRVSRIFAEQQGRIDDQLGPNQILGRIQQPG